MERKKRAQAYYEQAVLLDPDLAMAHFNLARLHMSSGAVDSAMFAYTTVLKLDPEYIPAYYRISQIYQLTGDYEKAIGIMEALLKIRPGLKEAQMEIVSRQSNSDKIA